MLEASPRPVAKRKVGQLAGGGYRKAIRAKWKAERRKPRSNRLHLSRRTRRKHRRAAR